MPSSAETSSSSRAGSIEHRLVEHHPGATGGELEVGVLDQPVGIQRDTGHGVIVDPVRVDHPVEGRDDRAGIDVDHPLLGVLGGDAAPDEHPVAGGAEPVVDVPAGGDEVGDRSGPVEAPAGDDGFVDAERDELGAVAGGPQRPVVAVLGVEPAHGQAGGEVPFDEPAERITAVEHVARRDDGEVAAGLELGVVPQHGLGGQIDAGQPDPAGRDDGPVAGGVEQRDGVVRRRDRRPQRGCRDVEQANGPVDRSDHVHVADGDDPRRGAGEVQGVAEVGGPDVDIVRVGRFDPRGGRDFDARRGVEHDERRLVADRDGEAVTRGREGGRLDVAVHHDRTERRRARRRVDHADRAG